MLLPLLFAVFTSPAQALTLSETDRSTLAPGVELVAYRTESPTTDTHVLEVDLCEDGIRLDATRTPTSIRTVASWAGDYGPVAAINASTDKLAPELSVTCLRAPLALTLSIVNPLCRVTPRSASATAMCARTSSSKPRNGKSLR